MKIDFWVFQVLRFEASCLRCFAARLGSEPGRRYSAAVSGTPRRSGTKGSSRSWPRSSRCRYRSQRASSCCCCGPINKTLLFLSLIEARTQRFSFTKMDLEWRASFRCSEKQNMELRLREERHSATKSAAFVLVQHNNTTSRQKKTLQWEARKSIPFDN